MPNFKPSKYQQAIFDFITTGTGNAVVNAVAGSGKTTTIVESLNLIDPNAVIYFLAFGKAIADEIRSRVPSYVNVSTLHSLGAKALYAARKSQMDEKKVFNVVSVLRKEWAQESGFVDADYTQRVYKLVDLFRVNLIDSMPSFQLMAQKHGIEIMNGEMERAMQVLNTITNDHDTHDFVDMLYFAATDPTVKLPKADWIFVDECQDLNKAQQAILAKMMHKGTRFIAVGDPRQAIYGFAGADEESFETLKAFPDTIELPLSFNYRCGSEIIEFIRNWFTDSKGFCSINIQAHEGAHKGAVNESGSFRDIKDGDMVLCRNTAPLVKLCLEFIKAHKKAYVKGGDIGKQMANMVTRSNAKTLNEFELWLERELSVVYDRLRKRYPAMTSSELQEENAYRVMADKKEVFETIIDSVDMQSPAELVSWINNLFSEKSAGICFSSAHKSKGLENTRIHIIELDMMPSSYAKKDWQLKQEDNLIYVAFTRAKNLLSFVVDWHFKKRD